MAFDKIQPPWSTEEQKEVHSPVASWVNTVIFAGTLSGIHFLGKRRFGNKTLYDRFVNIARMIEEYSPGNIFRTFQLSSFFSQFTSEALQPRFFEPQLFLKDAKLHRYFSNLIGGGSATYRKILEAGLTFKQNKLFWGQSEEVALKYAKTILNTPLSSGSFPAARWSKAYATHIGSNLSDLFFAQAKKGSEYGLQIIGGKSLPRHLSRQAAAWGTEFIGRFNRLLMAPAELPGIRHIFEKIKNIPGFKYGLGVKPGKGLSTLGRLVGKWGIGATLAYLGWKEIDRQFRNASILDKTILAEGTNAAIGTALVKTNYTLSKLADHLGLHGYREAQERVAPGSTSLTRLAAFPLIGATIGGGIFGYGRRILHTIGQQAAGKSILEASIEGRRFASSFEGLGPLAKLYGKISSKSKFIKGTTPGKFMALGGALLGTALVLPFIPGALIPSKRPEELEKIYSGEQEVPIKKGRWWEMGRSAYEGSNTQYFRKHWYPRLLARSKEKTLWGEEGEKLNEFKKYFLKEFTYHLEEKDKYGYKFPISSVPFEDVPLIGPLLAGTIGKWIKPPRLYHTEEWLRQGQKGIETITTPLGFGQEFHPELGEIPHGIPSSPYSPESTLREQTYRITEMIGLPGFVATSMKEKITGTQDLFSEKMELESFRRAHGAERGYWDEELGGVLGLSEFFRRLYPHRIRSVELYNPISSGAPSWLPGSGSKSPDFQHGALYTKVPLGEERLPGPGYAAYYPELEGVSPEDYPLIHRLKILGDVATYSDEYKQTLRKAQSQRKTSSWTDQEEQMYQEVIRQAQEKKQRKTLYPYQYLNPYKKEDTIQNRIITEINEKTAQGEIPTKTNIINSLYGGYWEWLAHNAEIAAEQLTPFAPASKLIHIRDPIEEYEKNLYGREMAFWQKPIEHFVKPYVYSTAHSMGWDGIPASKKKEREINEYFDILKYIKGQRLYLQSLEHRNTLAAKKYKTEKQQTLFGISPYTGNIATVFKAIPRNERNYFKSFMAAQEGEEREQILKMVPSNIAALYKGQWDRQFFNQAEKALEKDLLSGKLKEETEGEIERIRSKIQTEGFPVDESLQSEYIITKLPGENYPDWYRRTKILPQKLAGKSLPGPDWTGMHPGVDLDDIKLKLVEREGLDMHDFDLWPDRQRSLPYKPYLDSSLDAISQKFSESEIRDRLDQLFNAKNIQGHYSITEGNATDGQNSVTIKVDHNRSREAIQLLKDAINGR